LLDCFGDKLDVDDLAVTHGTLRQSHLRKALECCWALAKGKFRRAHARGPDVETDRGSSCHWFVLPYEINHVAVDDRSVCCLSKDEIGTRGRVLEESRPFELPVRPNG
jgi:hypothetical protein